MAIKSFNLEDETYRKFSEYCKETGLSMSKQVEFFMRSVVDEEPKARKEYLKKLEQIRKNRFIHVGDSGSLRKRYGL